MMPTWVLVLVALAVGLGIGFMAGAMCMLDYQDPARRSSEAQRRAELEQTLLRGRR